MNAFNQREEDRWQDGFVSGAVYNGDQRAHRIPQRNLRDQFAGQPCTLTCGPAVPNSKPKSLAMTANMFGAQAVTSSKTEDQIAARCRPAARKVSCWRCAPIAIGRDKRGIKKPELVAPVTAHVALDKAADYFNIRLRRFRLTTNIAPISR